MANFAAMNNVYAEVFSKDPKPVRTVSFISLVCPSMKQASRFPMQANNGVSVLQYISYL